METITKWRFWNSLSAGGVSAIRRIPGAETKRIAVGAELSTEIAPGHLLHGRIDRIEAFFLASDDVIVRLVDGTFALLHPTWSQRQETPPFPTSRLAGVGSRPHLLR